MKQIIYYIIPLAVVWALHACSTSDVEFEGVSISASPRAMQFESSRGMLPFQVTATTAWTVEYRDAGDEEWVTFSPDAGEGLGFVSVSVSPNGGAVRNSVIVVSNGEYSDSVRIMQLQGTGGTPGGEDGDGEEEEEEGNPEPEE